MGPRFLVLYPGVEFLIDRRIDRVLRCCSSRHVYQPSHISYAYQSEHLMCEVRSMDKLSVASAPCMRCHSSISHGRLGDPCGVFESDCLFQREHALSVKDECSE
jgi:hypothetical protein